MGSDDIANRVPVNARYTWPLSTTPGSFSAIIFVLWVCCTFLVESGQLVGVTGWQRSATTLDVAITGPAMVLTSATSTIKLSPVQILFCLSGNHTGFMSEFEVSLKSVMMNAPLERHLIIHVMADELAYEALDAVFARTELESWQSRTQVSIETYNVEQYIPAWENQVEDLLVSTGFQKLPRQKAFGIHTVGCWFRLFCHHVLKLRNVNDTNNDEIAVEHVLYLDPDVVIMANLEELWRHADKKYHFQWGIMECSGFLLLNVPKMNEIWQMAKTLPLYNISKSDQQDPNDQLVFRAVSRNSVNSSNNNTGVRVGILPEPWDMSVAAGIWRFRKNLVQQRPQVGMLHFNGGSSSKEAYFSSMPDFLDVNETNSSFGLAKYFIYMPWTWARFQAASMISGGMTADGQRPQGFALQLNHTNKTILRQNAHQHIKLATTQSNISSQIKRRHRRRQLYM